MNHLGQKVKGFTLVELIAVIVILGIVSVVALGRFENMSEEAHSAVASGVMAEFSSVAMTSVYNYSIENDADPTTVELRPGVTLPVNAQGWAGSPYNAAACLNLWQALLTSSQPMNSWGTVPLTTPADGWEYFGNGTLCLYLYKPDVTPFRIIIYFPDTGAAGSGRIFGFNI